MGTVERDQAAADKERRALEEDANAALSKRIKEKKKTRGRSKLKAKLKKRMKNVVSKETQLLKEKLAARKKKQADAVAVQEAAPSTALDRLFARSSRSR